MVRYCNKALSMILLLYNLFYMFYTYGLHPNFVFTKYGRDSSFLTYWAGLLKEDLGQQVTRGAEAVKTVVLLFHRQEMRS
jgi:hypothetical protein